MSKQVKRLPTPSRYAYPPGFALQLEEATPTLKVESFVRIPIARKRSNYLPRYLVEIHNLADQVVAYDYTNKGIYSSNDEIFFVADIRAIAYGSYKLMWRVEGVNNGDECWQFYRLEVMPRVTAESAYVRRLPAPPVVGLECLPTADESILKPADGCCVKTTKSLCASVIPGPPGANGGTPELRVSGGVLQWRTQGSNGAWVDLFNLGSLSSSVGWDNITGKPEGLCSAAVGGDGLYLEFKDENGDLIGKSLYENP